MFGSSGFFAYVLRGSHALFVLFVFIYSYKCSKQFPYQMMFVSCGLTVTRHVPLVEQKLPIPPEHLNSPQALVGFMLLNISALCIVFCRSLFVLFVIVLSVHRLTVSC